LPWVQNWLDGKQSVIDSAESNLFTFCQENPKPFWASLTLNLACHGMAILEVCLLLHFMGARTGLLKALLLEAFTKLTNVVGALNPGNFGTYEDGNMILARLIGITGTAGLTLGLCRRGRIPLLEGERVPMFTIDIEIHPARTLGSPLEFCVDAVQARVQA
jgi:hypothetical protein